MIEWLAAMGERGMYAGSTVSTRTTALARLASMLSDDEPSDPRSLLENLDGLTRRWATKHQANPNTANTYKSRARSTLREFLEYQEDPTKFPGS